MIEHSGSGKDDEIHETYVHELKAFETDYWHLNSKR
jgi:hypothetical protein